MKIVHVIPVLGCGGAEILVGGLALQQKKLGHEVRIVTLRPPHETFSHFPSRELLVKEIPIAVTHSRVNSLWRGKGRINLDDWKLFLKQFKPDVIHSHLFEADFLAHSIILSGVAYVTHFHGPFPEPSNKKSFPPNRKQFFERLEQQWLHRRYLKSQTHFIAISREMYEYAKRMIPASLQHNIHLLNNAIDAGSFPFRQRKKISAPYHLITVGNLLERKNHAFLIRVVAKLLQHGAMCHLTILGYGALEEELRKLIDSLKVKDHVHLAGSVGNVSDYLSQADIYIHAAQPEPFGIAILEAMATGLPVVALDGGGTGDIVQDGINGFLLRENNIDAFAEKIEVLLQDHALYQAMSKQAGDTASKFDIQNYAIETLRIYGKELKERKMSHG